MESSNVGPVYDKTAAKKFGFNKDLLASFKYLNDNKKFQLSLNNIFNSIGPFKYEAEIFPVLTHEGDDQGNIVFVATKYNRSKLGQFGAFVVFKVFQWNDTSFLWFESEDYKRKQALNLLKYESSSTKWNNEWRIYTNDDDLKIKNGIFSVYLDKIMDYYLGTQHMFERALTILRSRSSKSALEKEQIIKSLKNLRDQFQYNLDYYANVSKTVLGNGTPVEGVILKFKNNENSWEMKGTSDAHDRRKEILWKDRVNVLNLELEMENRILKEVLSIKTTQPAALNREIRKAAELFTSNTENANTKYFEFLGFLLPYLVEQNIDFDLTKEKLSNIIGSFRERLELVQTNFETNLLYLDHDSVRKTQEFIKAFDVKFQSIRNILHSPLNGSDFYYRVFDLVLGYRVNKIIDFNFYEDPYESEREKVIIWIGRAQPWHKGHDLMIEKGKEYLPALGASKILIMLIRGTESSKDLKQNPLNEKEQVELIYSLYKDDSQVEIYKKFPKTGFIKDIADHLHSSGYIAVGWLAGEDRIVSYRRELKYFEPIKYVVDHDFSPFLKDKFGNPRVEMIETPRITSGAIARESALSLNDTEWIVRFAPAQTMEDELTKQLYLNIYYKLRGEQGLLEMSAMGAGAVAGLAGPFKRKDDEK